MVMNQALGSSCTLTTEFWRAYVNSIVASSVV